VVVFIKKAGHNRFLLEKKDKMLVGGVLFLSDALHRQVQGDNALTQLAQAAELPGAFKHVVGLPDIHSGFGLPIGGVLATDAESGVVSAGAVGMDINCGVRLLATDIRGKDLPEHTWIKLLAAVEKRIPSGIGKQTPYGEYRGGKLDRVLARGAQAIVEDGYGSSGDVEHTEENGLLSGADPTALPKGALKRLNQLSTLGGGNHFLEFCQVEKVLEPHLAQTFGLTEGNLAVLIHSGSRGLGHEVCTHFSRRMVEVAPRYGIVLPSKGLAAVPIDSAEGRQYLAAMSCAVNYAFANRQLMAHGVRAALTEVLGQDMGSRAVKQVYDVAHNIAKFEIHFSRRLLVHRKGATRALPPGHPQNPGSYRSTGHPALIPGSMATGSYVVVGTEKLEETFYSVNHGAGRIMSRTEAKKKISVQDMRQSLGAVRVNSQRLHGLLDEAPAAYKDIDEVTGVLADIGYTRLVVRLKPLAVIKGEGDE
jgi:tRNA-splicing ligase RtcB